MQSDLIKELSTNFIEYAVSVNSDRAIPNAADGLKPVAKRILYGAFTGGRTSNKPHVKCAKIVGDVMGSYHPHGDSSIYGALVRLAQDWVMRYPLIDFHGNVGNQAGDGPAAPRYTEARLSKLTEDGLLQGIKKANVDFIPNYDETTEEPVSLPSVFPNLLCNPNSGIGVAMACSWAPHNLNEVANAIFDYLDGKEPMLPGPDFPTGGIIINKNDIPMIMKTGHGSVKVRGKFNIDKQKIIFTEIPYGTSVEGLMTEIGKVCDEKEIEGISNIRDESNKKGVRIVIECDRGIDPLSLTNKLFSKTNLQTSFSYNQVALIDKVPTELNLKQCIEIYVNHNIECIIRETKFDLQKATDRLEIVNGLLKALEDIDNIISLIKNSDNANVAKINLINKYSFTENQAKAILAMRLSSLAKLEKVELNKEAKDLLDTINTLTEILNNNSSQKEILKNRLINLVKKYGDKRRTEITQINLDPKEKEIAEVVPEDVVIILTESGYIKRVPKKNFKIQKRNGKGIKTLDEVIFDSISTNTIDSLLVFTNKGKMFRLLVDKIPEGTNASKGQPLSNLINFEPDEKISAITSLNRKNDFQYVIFLTKNGLIKKTSIEEYKNIKRTTGIQAIKLKPGDSLIKVFFANKEEFMIITKHGLSIRFETKDISPIGRVASGVKAIKLIEDDEVLTGFPLQKDSYIAVFAENGLGKMTYLNEYSSQARGGKGIYTYKTSSSTGDLVGALNLLLTDDILILGKTNSICISAKDLPVISRASLGNVLIKDTQIERVVKL